jgi:hypothetical protein
MDPRSRLLAAPRATTASDTNFGDARLASRKLAHVRKERLVR